MPEEKKAHIEEKKIILYRELRCERCNKKLAEVQEGSHISIKCSRCKAMNSI